MFRRFIAQIQIFKCGDAQCGAQTLLLMEKLRILSLLLTVVHWARVGFMVKLGQPLLHCVSVGFLALKVQFSEEVVPSVAVRSVCLWEEVQGPLTWTSWVGTRFFSQRSWSRRTAWRYLPAHKIYAVIWPLNWLYLYVTNVDSLPMKLKAIVRILPIVTQKENYDSERHEKKIW